MYKRQTDQRLVSELPSYIRENRVAIEAFVDVSGEVTSNDLSIATGTTTLVIPTNLSVAKIELIRVSAPGASSISLIQGGTAGQIKIFVFGDGNISLIDGLKATPGALYLDQLPALSTWVTLIDDVVALTNIGGNGGATYGYWKELWRLTSIK